MSENDSEDRTVGALTFTLQLEKDGPSIPFMLELKNAPPRIIITPEKCMPVIFTAQQLASIAIHTYKRHLDMLSVQEQESTRKVREQYNKEHGILRDHGP